MICTGTVVRLRPHGGLLDPLHSAGWVGATASRRPDTVVAQSVAPSLYWAVGGAASNHEGPVVRSAELFTPADAVNTPMVS